MIKCFFRDGDGTPHTILRQILYENIHRVGKNQNAVLEVIRERYPDYQQRFEFIYHHEYKVIRMILKNSGQYRQLEKMEEWCLRELRTDKVNEVISGLGT